MSTFEPGFIRSARVVSEISVVWTVCTSTLAIGLGIAVGSIVLIAFGAVGYVDAIGSVALVHHFRHALAHDELEDRFERRAHRVVTIGLLAVGSATIATSAIRLFTGGSPETSWAGIVTAGASLIVLSILSRRKQELGRLIPSAALISDGHLSAVGAMEAAVALGGIVVSSAFGWKWADAVAALIVGCVAVGLGVQAARSHQ